MLALVPDRPALCHDSETTLDLLIRITPDKPAQEKERPEINLSLVLDRSGSMAGQKLAMTREAAGLAVRQLREEDRVSVVVFDDNVQTLVPCGPAVDKQRIARLLEQVQPGGSTALCDGWRRGVEEAATAREARRINRVVLLTDGEANKGEVNADAICTQVRAFAAQGVQTTTLGFGASYNETLLRSMAASGEGNHFYVERPDQLADFFQMELGGLAATRGTRVRLALETLPGVSVEPLFGMETDEQGRLMLGDLVAGNPLEILVRLRVPAQSVTRPILTARLSYHSLDTERTESLESSLELMLVSAIQRAEIRPQTEVRARVATAVVARLRAEAMELVQQRQEGAAMRLLREALRTPHLPAEEHELLQDLIETLERRDYSSGHKKAAMHGHGHSKGHGHYGLRPRSSADALTALMNGRRIALRPGPLLASRPAPGARPWDRFQGMLRGLAHGEARGNAQAWADVDGASRPGVGEATGLTIATLRHLADWGGFNAARLANELRRAPVARVSPSLSAFRKAMQEGEDWHEAGARSAGCGALRRVAPLLVVGEGLWSNVAIGAMLTHNDSASLASCLGFAAVLWELLAMDRPPAPTWYGERFLEAIEGLETEQTYSVTAPRYDGWQGSLHDFVRERLADARQRGLDAEQALREWGSGPFVFEMVPDLLWILERHGAHPDDALRAATRTSLEAGSLGALVGAAVGALHGTAAGWELDDELEQVMSETAKTFQFR